MPARIKALYNIMPIENIQSVLEKGILCKERADRLSHRSVAMKMIQDKRENIKIPGGFRLHQYANLFFNPRNTMMFSIKDKSDKLCVLEINKKVLDLPNVVLADRNASSSYVSFYPSKYLNLLDFDKIFIRDWRSDEEWLYFEQRSKVCAEVLVPIKVPTEYIQGAFVDNEDNKILMQNYGFKKLIKIEQDIFFQ